MFFQNFCSSVCVLRALDSAKFRENYWRRHREAKVLDPILGSKKGVLMFEASGIRVTSWTGLSVTGTRPRVTGFSVTASHIWVWDVSRLEGHGLIGERRCGTYRTTWISGGHPNNSSDYHKEVMRTINIEAYGNVSSNTTNALVVNCGDFYVYYLKDTGICNSVYCGE